MKITSLDPEPSGSGIRLRVDGEPFVTIGPEDVLAASLAVGMELSEGLRARLAHRAEVFAARSVAMRLLSSRAIASGELARRLLRRGHARWAVEEAIAFLMAAGLIDDTAFAQHYARTRARNRRYGPRRLRADLRRMGIADRIVERAVAEALEADGTDPKALIREAAMRKVRAMKDIGSDKAKRRLRAYLQRRGFSNAEIADVVKETLAG